MAKSPKTNSDPCARKVRVAQIGFPLSVRKVGAVKVARPALPMPHPVGVAKAGRPADLQVNPAATSARNVRSLRNSHP